ncbi:hypothetical protein BGZ73_006193 [Actinomortierella ambigua]|nr:hypothetical protein BGZ73_006193 [Actinomortierella ambigua]
MVAKDIQTLKELNINSVRLGHYNQTYLDISAGIVRELQENGIYTLIDFHQDCLAPQFCGHGAPAWFVKLDWVEANKRFPVPQTSRPFAVDGNGIPSEADCNSLFWPASYLNYAISDAFERLYSNYDHLGDSWANYWKVLATTFKDFPGVQGYNLMNEPWVGNHMADASLLIPGYGDRMRLEGFWNKGIAAIRSIDPTTLVHFEGPTIDILSGFSNVPGGDGSKAAHSWHYYSPPQLGSFETTMKNRYKDKKRLRCGSICTEFSIWLEGDIIEQAYEAVRAMDRHLESWQGWAYENLWDSSVVHPTLALIYARTYAEATAGTALSFYFQETTAKYWVTWTANTSITAPSLIRIAPKYFYPDGIRVFFEPEHSGRYTLDGDNVVRLDYTPQTVDGAVIEASVQPFFPTDAIKSLGSENCWDAQQGKIPEEQPVVMRPCTPQWSQTFKFKNGKIMLAWDHYHQHDKYCLDIAGDPSQTSEYQGIVLNLCQEDKLSQQWEATATGAIINRNTGNCIDILDSKDKNDQVQGSQHWALPRGANGSW